MKVCCLGAGYIGGPTMAVMAKYNPSIKFIVVDTDDTKIDKWNSEELPIYEPNLLEIVHEVRNTNLIFTSDIRKGIEDSEIIFIGVPTPTKSIGNGLGYASDLTYWENAARMIASYSKSDKIIVEKSTVPTHTADALSRILKANSPYKFTILSNPEFLAEGTAIDNLINPDRVLIGGPADESKLLVELYHAEGRWVPKDKIILTNLWSAELSKLAANAMLAQRVSSINSLSSLCEKTGADIREVSKVVGMDSRIGNKFLNAGPGFGGSCFKKDLLNLIYLCKSYGLVEESEYWEQVLKINDHQQSRLVKLLIEESFNTMTNKNVAVLGIAFKSNTGDTRESPAISMIDNLLVEGALVRSYDPVATYKSSNRKYFECSDPYAACYDADSIVIATEWDQFRNLDWNKIYDNSRRPATILDTRNLLCDLNLPSIGFKYIGVGKCIEC